jgi:phosphohistidine phosphatase
MKILTLIRHAKSDWSDPDLADFDRPLNGRGKRAAPLMGLRLSKRTELPELIFTSAAKRARKTAKLIAQQLQLDKEDIIIRSELYAACRTKLVECIQNFPDSVHIALVAHNPELTELGQWLCSKSPEWLPTCALLTLKLKIEGWDQLERDCGEILNYDYPKKRSAGEQNEESAII